MDSIIGGLLLDNQIRVYAIDGHNMTQTAQNVHRLSHVATAALGRQLMMTAILTLLQKGSADTVTTIISGDGAAGNMVCVGRERGLVKGYATHPAAELPLLGNSKLDVGGYVGRTGKLSVIRDNHMREPFAGSCNLVSGEIAEDFAQYFTVSEQTPSLVYLGVHIDPQSGAVISAAGLLAQPLPNCSDDAIAALEGQIPEIQTLCGRLSAGVGLGEALADIFGDFNWNVTSEVAPRLECDCTRDRLTCALLSLGKTELHELMESDGQAELTCRFCETSYLFTRDDLSYLMEEENG